MEARRLVLMVLPATVVVACSKVLEAVEGAVAVQLLLAIQLGGGLYLEVVAVLEGLLPPAEDEEEHSAVVEI
jgi:hypothetical protein